MIQRDRGGQMGIQCPTIANILKGKSRPDMDQDMAVLTEMVQTDLYIQELSRLLYEEFMAALQCVNQVEDRNIKLQRDVANC